MNWVKLMFLTVVKEKQLIRPVFQLLIKRNGIKKKTASEWKENIRQSIWLLSMEWINLIRWIDWKRRADYQRQTSYPSRWICIYSESTNKKNFRHLIWTVVLFQEIDPDLITCVLINIFYLEKPIIQKFLVFCAIKTMEETALFYYYAYSLTYHRVSLTLIWLFHCIT